MVLALDERAEPIRNKATVEADFSEFFTKGVLGARVLHKLPRLPNRAPSEAPVPIGTSTTIAGSAQCVAGQLDELLASGKFAIDGGAAKTSKVLVDEAELAFAAEVGAWTEADPSNGLLGFPKIRHTSAKAVTSDREGPLALLKSALTVGLH